MRLNKQQTGNNYQELEARERERKLSGIVGELSSQFDIALDGEDYEILLS